MAVVLPVFVTVSISVNGVPTVAVPGFDSVTFRSVLGKLDEYGKFAANSDVFPSGPVEVALKE